MRRPRLRTTAAVAMGSLALAAAATVATVPAGAAPSAAHSAGSSSGASSSGSGSASNPFCTPALFGQAQQTVESALTNRADQLTKLVNRVDAAKDLTSSDRSALVQTLTQTDQPGIAALQSKVPGDTTCLELLHDAKAMVFDYRVFVVATPQSDLVIATDAISTIDGTMKGYETRIQHAIASAQAAGKDVSGAQGAFADYQTQVTNAASLMNGQSATLLAQTPSGAPGNASVFTQAFANCQNAHNDLVTARNDLQTIISDLTGTSATTTSGASAN